jgi:hypothetical protein
MPRNPWNELDWASNDMTQLHVGEWPQVRDSSSVLTQDPMQDEPSRPAEPAPASDAVIPGEHPWLPAHLLILDDTPRRAKTRLGALRLAALAGASRLTSRR